MVSEEMHVLHRVILPAVTKKCAHRPEPDADRRSASEGGMRPFVVAVVEESLSSADKASHRGLRSFAAC